MVDGVLVVDKPSGPTSFQVVDRVRKATGARKAGHTGTLDPLASGVLAICLGEATKVAQYLTAQDKAYDAVLTLGTATDSLDAQGQVTERAEVPPLSAAQVEAALGPLRAQTEQVPPMVSAVKIDGKRLHELAREGKEVDRAPRPVTIHELTVGPVGVVTPPAASGPDGPTSGTAADPVDIAGLERIGGEATPEWVAAAAGGVGISFSLAVSCSSGTYIRTLAQDIGAALGGGAHLVSLRRTSVGPYTLADAVALDHVAPERALPVADAVRSLPHLTVDEALAADVAVGKVLERPALGIGPDEAGEWAVFDAAGRLLAVYEPFRGTTVKPSLVIPT